MCFLCFFNILFDFNNYEPGPSTSSTHFFSFLFASVANDLNQIKAVSLLQHNFCSHGSKPAKEIVMDHALGINFRHNHSAHIQSPVMSSLSQPPTATSKVGNKYVYSLLLSWCSWAYGRFIHQQDKNKTNYKMITDVGQMPRGSESLK